MGRPIFRIFASLLWAFWMLIVVPGHERGILPLCPECDAAAAQSSLPACCLHPPETPAAPEKPAHPRGCLICYTVSAMGITPSWMPVISQHELQTFALPLPCIYCVSQEQPSASRCRGPPAC